MAVAIDFFSEYQQEGERILDCIITGDETLPENKQWFEKLPVKFKSGHSAQKLMCTVFWDARGMIHIEYSRGWI